MTVATSQLNLETATNALSTGDLPSDSDAPEDPSRAHHRRDRLLTVYGLSEERLSPMLEFGDQSYSVLGPLGEGAFAKVIEIQNNLSKETFALKLYTYLNMGDLRSSARTRMFFLRNNLTASASIPEYGGLRFAPRLVRVTLNPQRRKSPAEVFVLRNHPNQDIGILLPVAKYALSAQIRYLSENLLDRIVLANKVFEDVLPELTFLAKKGLSLGDIKSQNILMSRDGAYGLSDFDGLVPFGEKSLIATSDYTPPGNQRTGARAQPFGDVYSFNLVLAELLLRDAYLEPPVLARRSPVLLAKIREEMAENFPGSLGQYGTLIQFIEMGLIQDPIRRGEALKTLDAPFAPRSLRDWQKINFPSKVNFEGPLKCASLL